MNKNLTTTTVMTIVAILALSAIAVVDMPEVEAKNLRDLFLQ